MCLFVCLLGVLGSGTIPPFLLILITLKLLKISGQLFYWLSQDLGLSNVSSLQTPILWPPDAKNWLIGKDLDAGKDWRQEEKGMTEEEMVGWHHQLDGHEFEQAPGVGDGQGSLACCSPWDCKESDTTELLNWTECFLMIKSCIFSRNMMEMILCSEANFFKRLMLAMCFF